MIVFIFFSFSGLKTAVRVAIEKLPEITEQDQKDICASFQKAVVSQMEDRLKNAIAIFKENYPDAKDMVVAGGVAANMSVRNMLQSLADKNGLVFSAPPIGLCTDNGVMIAWAGMERFLKGKFDGFDLNNGFNEEYAEFFIKYYNHKDFMIDVDEDEWGDEEEIDLIAASYNNFKNVKKIYHIYQKSIDKSTRMICDLPLP